MSRRFSIFGVLALTTIVAVYSAFIGDVTIGWLTIYCLVAYGFVCLVAWLSFKLNYFMAVRLSPWLLKHRKLHIAEKIFGFRDTALALNERATRVMYSGKVEAAETACTLLDKALELDVSFATIWTNRASCHLLLGRLEAAIVDATEALKVDDQHQQALVLRGVARMYQEDHVGALKDLDQVECTTADLYNVVWMRGCAHEKLKQWKQAMSDYLLATQLDSTQLEAALALVRIQAGCPIDELRDGPKAVENASTICHRTNWRDWVALSVLASAYAECGDFSAALQYAQLAYELAPEDEKPKRLERLQQYQRYEPYRLQVE